MLPLIFPLFAGSKIHGASPSTDVRSLSFLRAADHDRITRCTARFRRGILGETGNIVGGANAAFRLVQPRAVTLLT